MRIKNMRKIRFKKNLKKKDINLKTIEIIASDDIYFQKIMWEQDWEKYLQSCPDLQKLPENEIQYQKKIYIEGKFKKWFSSWCIRILIKKSDGDFEEVEMSAEDYYSFCIDLIINEGLNFNLDMIRVFLGYLEYLEIQDDPENQ